MRGDKLCFVVIVGKEITEDAKFCTYCGKANSKLIIQENREDGFIQITENFAVNEEKQKN